MLQPSDHLFVVSILTIRVPEEAICKENMGSPSLSPPFQIIWRG